VFEELQLKFRNAHRLLDSEDPARRDYYELVARLDAAIDDAVANPFLVSTLASVRTHTARLRRLSQDNPERLREAALEHLMIVDAIVDGAEALAAHAMQLHLHRSLKYILGSRSGRTTLERSA